MKKILFIAVVILATTTISNAQRFAYVNTDYILSNIPEYAKAQEQIEKITTKWRGEVDKNKKIDELYHNFQNEQYLLTEEQKKTKIAEIEDKEKALKENIRKPNSALKANYFKTPGTGKTHPG